MLIFLNPPKTASNLSLAAMGQFHVQDTINLLSKLTFRRLMNVLKVWSSYRLSRLLKKPIQWGIPYSVSFEPTTSCNLRCPECPSGLRAFTRPTGMAERSFFERTIDDLEKELLYLIFYFQGEPYLHPQFTDLVQYAASKNIYTATSTNGHYLTDEKARATIESGLDRLIISIDGTTQDVYQQYRVGGKLEKVIEGTKKIVQWKRTLNSKKPFVVFQFLVVKPNEHQTEAVKQLAKECGVDDVWFKTAQVYDYENDPNRLIPENQKFSRYKKLKDGSYAPRNPLLNHCWKLWHANVITWDGLVVPCCFDKDAQHPLGDLKHTSFRSVWKSPAYRQFRKKLMKGRKEIDICSNCSEGLSVWSD
jgi:radical SAM protein with 4Fe4S-binding SPASM domain